MDRTSSAGLGHLTSETHGGVSTVMRRGRGAGATQQPRRLSDADDADDDDDDDDGDRLERCVCC